MGTEEDGMILMRWFWTLADGETVVSLKHQLSGKELQRSHAEGWHRIYGDVTKYRLAPGVKPDWEAGIEPLISSGALERSLPSETGGETGGMEATAPEIPRPVSAALEAQGRSLGDLSDMSDDEILDLPGVGPAGLRAIREVYPPEEDSEEEE